MKVKSLSHVRLLATPWTAAHQATPSMGFSRQEHWSGVPFPSPVILISIIYLKSDIRQRVRHDLVTEMNSLIILKHCDSVVIETAFLG